MLIALIKKLLDTLDTKYGSSMQDYIESKRPQSVADVERLETEYQRTLGREQWL